MSLLCKTYQASIQIHGNKKWVCMLLVRKQKHPSMYIQVLRHKYRKLITNCWSHKQIIVPLILWHRVKTSWINCTGKMSSSFVLCFTKILLSDFRQHLHSFFLGGTYTRRWFFQHWTWTLRMDISSRTIYSEHEQEASRRGTDLGAANESRAALTHTRTHTQLNV